MKSCPNDGCPHYKRVGSPAEYADSIRQCADCGSVLVDSQSAAPAAAASTGLSNAGPPPVGALAVTVIGALAPVLFGLVLLPGIDRYAVEQYSQSLSFISMLEGVRQQLSVVALGLSAISSAVILVELVHATAWLVRGRKDLPRKRRSGWLSAVVLTTLGVLAIQAWGIENFLLAADYEFTMLTRHGALWSSVRMTTLVAGSLGLLGVAYAMSRRGLGHGLAVLLGLNVAVVASLLVKAYRWAETGQLPVFGSLLGLGVLAAVAAGTWRLSDQTKRIAVAERSVSLNPLVGGIVPFTVAPSIVLLVTTYFPDIQALQRFADPTGITYASAGALLLVVAGIAYVKLSWRPGQKLGLLMLHGLIAQDDEPRRSQALADLRAAQNEGLVATLVVSFVLFGASLVVAQTLHFGVDAVLAVVTGTAVIKDLVDAWRFRREHPDTRVVAVTHDVEEAMIIIDRIEAQGVAVQVDNRQLRPLLTFLGPLYPLVVRVPHGADVSLGEPGTAHTQGSEVTGLPLLIGG